MLAFTIDPSDRTIFEQEKGLACLTKLGRVMPDRRVRFRQGRKRTQSVVLRGVESAQPFVSRFDVDRYLGLETTTRGTMIVTMRAARRGLVANSCLMLLPVIPADYSTT